jgi:hypothetical protein
MACLPSSLSGRLAWPSPCLKVPQRGVLSSRGRCQTQPSQQDRPDPCPHRRRGGPSQLIVQRLLGPPSHTHTCAHTHMRAHTLVLWTSHWSGVWWWQWDEAMMGWRWQVGVGRESRRPAPDSSGFCCCLSDGRVCGWRVFALTTAAHPRAFEQPRGRPRLNGPWWGVERTLRCAGWKRI